LDNPKHSSFKTPKMADEHICPYWMGYLLASPIRKLAQNPYKFISPYVKPGMTLIDAGCAFGFLSFPMAKISGDSGKVICIDVQQKMLDKLMKRAKRKKIEQRIIPHLSSRNSLRIEAYENKVDFALAFAVVHETSFPVKFIEELAITLKPGGKLLIAEPSGHVSEELFQESLDAGISAGLKTIGHPEIKASRVVLFQK
jgi:ubiquinone/menaquinone biosynthesis C-methylase UbiE